MSIKDQQQKGARTTYYAKQAGEAQQVTLAAFQAAVTVDDGLKIGR